MVTLLMFKMVVLWDKEVVVMVVFVVVVILLVR